MSGNGAVLGGNVNGFDVSSASFAYPAVGGDERAALVDKLRSPNAALSLLREQGVAAFVLSTCLRLEIVVSGSAETLDEALQWIFGEMELPSGIMRRQGTEAVEYLFRIVAGLESPVIGEREILIQFREAVAGAKEHGGVSGSFVGWMNAAIATARAVREELVEDPEISMATIAAGLVGEAERVAVFGYGTMGRALAEAVLAMDHEPTVEVYVRRPELVVDDRVSVHPLGEAVSAVASAPAVLSATSAKTRILADGELNRALSRRKERLILIDLAMPPDFAPDEGALVDYFNIDYLASLARTRIATGGADRLVAAAADGFVRKVVSARRAGHVIKHLFENADEVVNDVVSRLAGKLVEPEDRELLKRAAHNAVRKVLDSPVRYVVGKGADDVDVIAAAFGLDTDA